MISRVFRAFLTFLIAVPFGPGGLCCCVVGKSCDEEALAQPVASCCATEAASTETASEETPSCPKRDEEDCSCPMREAFLGAQPASENAALSTAPAAVAPAMTRPVSAEHLELTTGAPLRRVAHPPPKTPLYRTHCAILR